MSGAPFISSDAKNLSELNEWAQKQPAIGRCAFCPDWSARGTIEEVRRLSGEHRRAVHPTIKYKKRRPKANLSKWRSRLDEQETAEIAEERSRRMYLLGIRETETAP